MTSNDEIAEVKKALTEAQTALHETEATAAVVRSKSNGIRRIVERNGYVDRFRDILRGT